MIHVCTFVYEKMQMGIHYQASEIRTDLNATRRFNDIPLAKNNGDHFITDGFSILNLNHDYVTFQRVLMTGNVFSAQTVAVTGIMISRSSQPQMCIFCH